MSSIEVVIVTWNSGETIENCLDSCRGLPVTVVDNASRDDTLERVRRYPDVYLISNGENRGFAAAVNQGISRTGAEFVLLLNPDVELLGSVEALVEACGQDTTIAAGRLVDASGATQTGFTIRRFPTSFTLAYEVLGLNRLFPRNRVNQHYRCLDRDLDSPGEVDQPAGAFLLFRRQLWRDLGGFDEQFFPVWFEDVDFCKRALEIGKIQYVPSVVARHRGGASIARLDWSRREVYWYGSLLRYACKHFSPFEFRGVCGAVVLGSAIRTLTGVFGGRMLKVIRVYAKTASLAAGCLVFGRMGDPARVEEVRQGSRVRTISSTK